MAKSLVLSAARAALLGTCTLLFVTEASADVIAQRKVAMQNNNEAVKVLAAMTKGETAFDGKAVAFAGYTIANDFLAARELFPEGSTGENSRAKPEIWQDMSGFVADLEKAEAASQAVAAAGEANDEAAFKVAMGELGNACGACHEKFRVPRN